MDKRTTGMKTPAAADQAAAIEREIEGIRAHLHGLVSELDSRRHGLNPVVAAQRHPVGFAIAGVLVVGAIGAAIFVHDARARRRSSWLERGRRLKGAVGDFMGGKAASIPPSLGMRMLGALATAAAGVAGKHLASRLFSRRG